MRINETKAWKFLTLIGAVLGGLVLVTILWVFACGSGTCATLGFAFVLDAIGYLVKGESVP